MDDIISKFDNIQLNYLNYYYRKFGNDNNDSFRNHTGLSSSKSKYKKNGFKLESFEINSEINDTSIIETWIQNYNNESNVPIEATYKLPLTPSKVVSKLIFEYQDKIYEGKIKEKSKAKEKYNDEISSGNQAIIGEKCDNDNLFIFTIGNIPANEKVKIKLIIISEIDCILSKLVYCLHKFLIPNGKFKFKFNLNIQLSTPIKSIELLENDDDKQFKPIIKHNENETNATIQYEANDGFNNSIIVSINTDDDKVPNSNIEFNEIENTYAIALNFYPSFNIDKTIVKEINQKSEYIFVVDYSGSMEGEPIEKAKDALEICLRSLNENNRFNIYYFGSTFIKVFEESQLYNDESLEKASEFIESMMDSLGGTDILLPIKDIFETCNNSNISKEYPKQLFIFTDGAVNDTDELIEYVSKHSNSTRVFTIGIGSNVDTDLVIGLSKSCKGYYEFIDGNEELQEKVIKLLNISNEPMLSNISINWNGLSVIQSPSIIRPIFNGERMLIYGLLNNNIINSNIERLKQNTIELIGDGPFGEKIKFEINLDLNKSIIKNQNQNNINHNIIHTLFAFKYIQELEEQEIEFKKDNKNEIIKFGKQYGLASKYTSFIISHQNDNGQIIEHSMKSINILGNEKDSFKIYQNKCLILEEEEDEEDDDDDEKVEEEEEKGEIREILEEGDYYRFQLLNTSNLYSIDSDHKINEDNESNQDELDDIDEEVDEVDEVDEVGEVEEEVEEVEEVDENLKRKRELDLFEGFLHKKYKNVYYEDQNEETIENNNNNNNNIYLNLIKLQKASGYWIKSTINQFNIDMDKAPIELSKPDTENIWATFLVISKLNKEFSSKKNEWNILANKAIKWLKNQLKNIGILDKFDEFQTISNLIIG